MRREWKIHLRLEAFYLSVIMNCENTFFSRSWNGKLWNEGKEWKTIFSSILACCCSNYLSCKWKRVGEIKCLLFFCSYWIQSDEGNKFRTFHLPWRAFTIKMEWRIVKGDTSARGEINENHRSQQFFIQSTYVSQFLWWLNESKATRISSRDKDASNIFSEARLSRSHFVCD